MQTGELVRLFSEKNTANYKQVQKIAIKINNGTEMK